MTKTHEAALVGAVMRANQLLLGTLNEMLRPWGLSFARYEALALLADDPDGRISLGRLRDQLEVHPTSVTSLIDGLERIGLATREPHPTDRRTTLAVITQAGKETAAEASRLLEVEGFGLSALGDRELDDLRRGLAEVVVRSGS